MSEDNPLWLPEGSIRAIIAIIATIGALIIMYTSGEMPEWLITILASIIGFYFGTRGAQSTK